LAAFAEYNVNVWVDFNMSFFSGTYTPGAGGVYEAPESDMLINQSLIILGAYGIAPFVTESFSTHGGLFMYNFQIDYETVVFKYDPLYLGILGTIPA
ncbi:hypothetical protein KIPB_010748, partial [Kipferlia bialata]